MAGDFELIQCNFTETQLRSLSSRQRNQLVGCMHAQNELSFLNRLLMFALNDFSEGKVHDDAHSVQMWTVMQLLVGKLYETWLVVDERFLKASPVDEAVKALSPEHAEQLDWLKDHFGADRKNSVLRTIRDKTAFHYDKLNLDGALDNLPAEDASIYLAQHPVNGNYFLGSAVVFWTLFTMVADQKGVDPELSFAERVQEGVNAVLSAIGEVNNRLQNVLYGLTKYLLERAAGGSLDSLDQVRIPVTGAPSPTSVALPGFLDIAERQASEQPTE